VFHARYTCHGLRFLPIIYCPTMPTQERGFMTTAAVPSTLLTSLITRQIFPSWTFILLSILPGSPPPLQIIEYVQFTIVFAVTTSLHISLMLFRTLNGKSYGIKTYIYIKIFNYNFQFFMFVIQILILNL
jgi:hypothetical protein